MTPDTTPAPMTPEMWQNAYSGARDELATWKRRALDAEAKVRAQLKASTCDAEGAIRQAVFNALDDLEAGKDRGTVQIELVGKLTSMCDPLVTALKHIDSHGYTTTADHDMVRAALAGSLPSAPVEPVWEAAVTIAAIDEYGPMLRWEMHWVEVGVGAKLYARKP